MTEPPIVLPDFEEFGDQTFKGLETPEEATTASQALLKEDRDSGQPRIPHPGALHVTLERGIHRDGTWHRDAEVRELTGADEEAIAAAGTNSFRVFETLLLRGVRTIGDEFMSKKIAAELLIGDRELLIMAIRRATFGDDLEFERIPCPHCSELVDLTVPLDAVPLVHLDEHDRIEYEVPLRHGDTAVVRLPTGDDQAAVLAIQGGNGAKQDSEILGRCVLRIRHTDGSETRRPSAADLRMGDRRTILSFLADTQPGPRYGDFSFVHETCGEEVPLPISLAVLFRGM
ncbi:hypothetical protein ACF06W_11545 [Streptomyces albus]|uniref:T4 family baseplate hub assembly chaperone n=1 Tax=Streptomyces albus TaxID=1888 RepID=UPI0036FD4112